MRQTKFLSLLGMVVATHASPSQSYPSCYQEGVTWTHTGLLAGIPSVESPYICQANCSVTPACSSFTWYDQTSPLTPEVCILYETTEEEADCPTCVSGPASCTCSSEYACVVSGNNLLGITGHVNTELECLVECFTTPDCSVYT